MPVATASPTVFALLDAEWATLARAPIPLRWRHHPALALPDAAGRTSTLSDLLQITERRDDPAASDQILAALAQLTRGNPDDDDTHAPLAARTLLQTLLPGAKALARRLTWLGDPPERAAAVTATLYEQIRSYPIQRRPARIAANLLADTHQRLLRHASASASASGSGSGAPHRRQGCGGGATMALPVVSLDELAAHGDAMLPAPAPSQRQPSPAEELLALLAWAVHGGWLTPAQATLIGQSRIADIPCEELGAQAGLGAHSLRRRRQRAEQALGRAATASALSPEELARLAPQLACRVPAT
ncbi:MAG TPA: hypothetical protein VF995_11300, partial [Actinomycetota bacterium]